LPAYERARLALKIEPIYIKHGKNNLSSGGKGFQISEKVNSQKEVGKLATLSVDTINKVKKIESKGSEETKKSSAPKKFQLTKLPRNQQSAQSATI